MEDKMTLGSAQQRFSRMVSDLLYWLHLNHYEVRGGEWWRSEEEAARLAGKGKGIIRSLHCDKLAIDLNIFQFDHKANGGKGAYVWLDKTEQLRSIGQYWKSIGGTWGGDFMKENSATKKLEPKPDGNHFSLAWEGRK